MCPPTMPLEAHVRAVPAAVSLHSEDIGSRCSNQPSVILPSASDVPGNEFGFILETFNGSGWGTARKRLEQTKAHIVCIQEHKLRSFEEIDQASAWGIRHG